MPDTTKDSAELTDSSIGVVEGDVANAVRRDQLRQALFGKPTHPRQIGRFQIQGTLGRGGMGVVLEAIDPTLDRPVALKLLNPRLDDRERDRLLREAQAMARLSHPNVVQVYEAGTTDDQPFIAMELIEGRTLQQWMRGDPRPDWTACVEVFMQVGTGLAAAHAQGLIHRDFKPGNAIIDDQGRARVLDFGLARQTGERLERESSDDGPLSPIERAQTDPLLLTPLMTSLTKTGAVVGTPAYMPPEQIMGQTASARSDQFSFCVALWEAVYGTRPFAGSSLAALLAAMISAQIEPTPKGSPVPAKLRTILLRGLALTPEDRWPSMDALLERLRLLVAPRRPIWVLGGGLAVGLAALGGGLGYQAYLEREALREREAQRCRAVQSELDGIWDDTRRHAVRQAIHDTGVSYAPSTWERVEGHLDDYAQAWLTQRIAACEAESTSDEPSSQSTLAQVRCLHERKAALQASIDMLAQADPQIVESAVDLVTALPRLTRCEDMDALLADVLPPEDPEVARKVQEQRDELAGIAVLHEAGKYDDALRQLDPLEQHAEALGYGPLRAEVAYWRGQLLSGAGQYEHAEQVLRQAHGLALEYGHDRVAIDVAQLLASTVGRRLARHDEGIIWGQMALAQSKHGGEAITRAKSQIALGVVFEQQANYDQAQLHLEQGLQTLEEVLASDHPVVAASLDNLGTLFNSRGDYDQAQLHLERAVDMIKATLGPEHPRVASTLHNLGIAVRHQGDSAQAQRHFEQALQINERALGPDHPEVATSAHNLGNVFVDQGDYDQAQLHFQRAIRIREQALGADHPSLAQSLVNLGGVSFSRGDYEHAKPHFQRALRINEEALGPDHPNLATGHNNLGSIFYMQDDFAQAKHHFLRALEISKAAHGADHPNHASYLANLGTMSRSLGEYEQAGRYYEQAVRVGEQALGPDHPSLAFSLFGLAELALNDGDDPAARQYAERTVSIREASTVSPVSLAKTRFLLARTLWSDRTQRERARSLAEGAQVTLTDDPKGNEDTLADITTWLAKHRGR